MLRWRKKASSSMLKVKNRQSLGCHFFYFWTTSVFCQNTGKPYTDSEYIW
jgi:hypothetical protein